MATPVVPDLRGVEPVPANAGLIDHAGEVAVQRGHRIPASEEPLKLRMVTITARLAVKHGPREQTLAPESDEPSRVQVTRMKRPESH
jgi:hypothetical protein